ncbi:MAG: hypothetical protein L6W00_03560 [Lentisphaeria bacterium]|nr:MAG: hypothetical protein L6W00_03560 [Lentisphaeria bacterium]
MGTLCRKLLPGYSQALQKKLSFAGVKLSVGSVCCAQIFLTLFCGVVACGVTALLVEPENRISIPIAGADCRAGRRQSAGNSDRQSGAEASAGDSAGDSLLH